MAKKTTVMDINFEINSKFPNCFNWYKEGRSGIRSIPEPKITSLLKHRKHEDVLIIKAGDVSYWLKIIDPNMEESSGIIIYMPGDIVYKNVEMKTRPRRGTNE